MNKIKFIYPILSAFLLCACQPSTNYNTPINETEETVRPVFDEDTAFAYIEKQVSFGPRVPNSPAHEKFADFLIEELGKWTDTVYVQAFEATAYNGQKLKGKILLEYSTRNITTEFCSPLIGIQDHTPTMTLTSPIVANQ